MNWRKYLDRICTNFTSREFIVFIVSTGLLIDGIIDEKIWSWSALGYMGVRTMQKLKEWNGKKEQS